MNHALFEADFMLWPNAQEARGIWDRIPLHIRRSFAPQNGIDHWPICMDISYYPLPRGRKPDSIVEYYPGKVGVPYKEAFAHLTVVDLNGRPVFCDLGNYSRFAYFYFYLAFNILKLKLIGMESTMS